MPGAVAVVPGAVAVVPGAVAVASEPAAVVPGAVVGGPGAVAVVDRMRNETMATKEPTAIARARRFPGVSARENRNNERIPES